VKQAILMLMAVSLVAMAAADETEPLETEPLEAEWGSIETLDGDGGDDGAVEPAKRLRGRDFVRLGKLEIRTGILVRIGHEWALKVDETTYDLHLGPERYRADQPDALKDGAIAEAKGFLYKTNMAVCTLKTAGTTLQLRSDTGRPAWAGLRLADPSAQADDVGAPGRGVVGTARKRAGPGM